MIFRKIRRFDISLLKMAVCDDSRDDFLVNFRDSFNSIESRPPDDAGAGGQAGQGAVSVEPSGGLPLSLPRLEAGERARRGSGQGLDL